MNNNKWRKSNISSISNQYNFNPHIYRKNYLDLQLLKYDNKQLYEHYILFGINEQRIAEYLIKCVTNVDITKDYNKQIIKLNI